MRPRRHARTIAWLALCAPAFTAFGQGQDLTLPPRYEEPGGTRLAERPATSDDTLDEIIVVGESEWRLPDLGSSWRAQQEAERPAERIEVDLLPLYDPQRDPVNYDPWHINPEVQRVGFIELFRIEFGERRE